MAVAACSANIDGIRGCVHRYKTSPHGSRRAGDFRSGLSTIRKLDEETGDFLIRNMAVEHGAKGGFCFILGKWRRNRRQGAHARERASIPQISRKLASMAWPCSVAMLSGWNCTP